MKKTKLINLVLITSALASCHQAAKKDYTKPNVYMRGDSSAPYSRTHVHGSNPWLWYYAFRPYGYYNNGLYNHTGYYSSGIHESSNIGTSTTKSGIIRGGFGGRGTFSVSS